MRLNDVRRVFLEFFGNHGHTVLPSAPLVPRHDPTVMFTVAGMVPFKNIFTGQETPPYPRAATSQKCVRAGGKHNDLDNVGYTARHHTFFEMLGNFSFGDYFKEQAIVLAWELLTKDFAMPKDKLLVTVYHTDDEAANLWKKIAGLPEEKILRIPTNDNFWSMGDTGPCGPCSEIFYDHGEDIPGGPPGSPEEDGDRFIEIWNLVFMQYEQFADGNREPLPKPSIDTGMGLERLSAVLQGVHDNYDIDLFKTLVAASKEASGNRNLETSHRVIADHLRSSAFLIADGVLPSNEGRGYVLRRIMRRAMRHAHILGCKEPLMHRLVPTIVSEMGGHYPELTRAQAAIADALKSEEERFRETLGRGIKRLEEASANLTAGQSLVGEVAFELYDTYGFPLDLTQDILRARGIGVDTDGFDTAMEQQRERARAAWAGSGEKASDTLWLQLADTLPPTEFTGYDAESGEGKVVALVQNGAETKEAHGGEAWVVTDRTPFYAESGGQIGDTGTLNGGQVLDTQKYGGLHAHRVQLQGPLKVGDTVRLAIDAERRRRIRAHHSATHLLHAALRRRLGEHVTQKGSLVADDKLRFDFSHNGALSREEIRAIETDVNRAVLANAPVVCETSTPDEAMAKGAMALFGEKYGDTVRTIRMGRDEEPSFELCGGTHVRATGDIGAFKIVAESAIASGVRRVEAVVGEAALAYFHAQDDLVKDLAGLLKTHAGEVMARVQSLMDEKKKLEKELADARRAAAMGGASDAAPEDVNGVKFLAKVIDLPPKDLRPLAEDLRKKLGSGVVLAASGFEGKASLVVAVTPDLAGKVDAVALVKAGAAAAGGQGGGGKPDMAQAGGPDGGKLEEAVKAVRDSLR